MKIKKNKNIVLYTNLFKKQIYKYVLEHVLKKNCITILLKITNFNQFVRCNLKT